MFKPTFTIQPQSLNNDEMDLVTPTPTTVDPTLCPFAPTVDRKTPKRYVVDDNSVKRKIFNE